MTQEEIEALRAEIEETKGVQQSAIVALNGIAGRIQSGIDAALAGGATAEQLAPLLATKEALDASNADLAAAVAANS